MPDCRTCLGEHDTAIHDATLRVRRWFLKTQVDPRPIQKAAKPAKPPKPGLGPFQAEKRYNRYERDR